jgi:predicted alpha/beta-hydrolase family hydrolase
MTSHPSHEPAPAPQPLQIALDGGQTVTALHYAPADPLVRGAFIIAHGAGAGQLSPFMVVFARAIAARGVDAVTFNFPYTEQRRRLPDRAPILEACFARVVHETRRRVPSAAPWLFIGGKSMGGRIATQAAAADPHLPVAGLILLGYPLHPPGKPDQLRATHLPAVRRPMLVVQGSRDTFGSPDEIRPVFESLAPPATLHIVEGGDHSFKVSRAGPAGQAASDEAVRQACTDWMTRIMRTG